jgi:hypothetical protein
MSVELVISYSKKIGLPEFSSHCLSVEVRTEIGSLQQLEAEVDRLYARVQQSVDAHIVNPGYVSGNGHKAAKAEQPWKCSEKQRNLILRLTEEHHLDKAQLDTLATERFGHNVIELNRLEASGFIDELFERCRTNGNGVKRQLPAARRAA